MSDTTTTLAQLREEVLSFVRERDWEQFHTPKNLSMSIAIEAAELMEHFQWLSAAESQNLETDKQQAVSEELSDIVIYALSMANALHLDLAGAIRAKMAKNIRKYPSDKVRGKAHKYTYYQDRS